MRCHSAEDVAAAIAAARARGAADVGLRRRPRRHRLRGRRRRGVHRPARHRRRRGRRRGRAPRGSAAGATWGAVDAATQEHGLAVTGGRVRDHRGRRPHARERQRLAGAPVRLHLRQPGRGRGRHRRRPQVVTASEERAPGPVLGACAAAAATSASSPSSPSGCTRSARSCSAGCCMYPAGAGARRAPAWRDFMADAPDELGGGGRVHHRAARGLRPRAGARPARRRRDRLLRR